MSAIFRPNQRKASNKLKHRINGTYNSGQGLEALIELSSLDLWCGKTRSCYFALELTQVARSCSTVEDELNTIRVNLLGLLAVPHLTLGLRYLAAGGHLRVYLLVCVRAATLETSMEEARALRQDLLQALNATVSVYSFAEVVGKPTLEVLFAGTPAYGVEIVRRQVTATLNSRERLEFTSPFIPSKAPINHLLRLMVSSSKPCSFQIWSRGLQLTERERNELQHNYQQSAACNLTNLDPSLLQTSLAAMTVMPAVLFGEVFETRLALFGTGPLSPVMVAAAGQAVTAPAGLHDGKVSGGFELRPLPTEEASRLEFSQDFRANLRGLFPAEELLACWRLPQPSHEGIPGMKSRALRHVAYPTLPEDGLRLGRCPFQPERPIYLDQGARPLHVYIMGQTGCGKSTLISQMASQDMLDGKGLAVVDPHGDLIEDLLGKIPPERIDDVIVFDVTNTEWPLGLNLLEAETVHQRDFALQEAISIFYRLFDPNRTGMIGPQWEHWMRNAALTLMTNARGGSILDVPFLFIDDDFLEERLDENVDATARVFWREQMTRTTAQNKSEMLNYFVSKFGRFLSNTAMRNIMGQAKSSFDLRQVMDSGKILLVNLARGVVGDTNCESLGMILTSKLFMAAASRCDIPSSQRRPFSLYLDEFQNFATESVASMLSEARKFGLHLVLAHQFTSQLPDSLRAAVLGNVGTLIAFRTGPQDAKALQHHFLPRFDAEDLMSLPNHRAYLRAICHGEPQLPFPLATDPPAVSNTDQGDRIRDYALRRWGRPRHAVERELNRRLPLG